MLAKRRGLYKGSREVIRTPLLLPSFSSKGFPAVQNILATTQEVIDGEILVSAYDIFHSHITGPFEFAQSVFLDSGGYEASEDADLSEFRKGEYHPSEWSIDQYSSTISGWNCTRPTVFISYDHPKDRVSTADQIDRAASTLPIGENHFREILFKPEAVGAREINVQAIIENVHSLFSFDVIGVTEKEIGYTLQSRMNSIARLRKALDEAGLDKIPIHIFGSLDTISTPLYFVAGADIFDGLTWLRFAYRDGMTVYRQNHAALEFGTDIGADLADARCFFSNYQYLKNMQVEMKNFLLTETFDSFTFHRELIEQSLHTVIKNLEV